MFSRFFLLPWLLLSQQPQQQHVVAAVEAFDVESAVATAESEKVVVMMAHQGIKEDIYNRNAFEESTSSVSSEEEEEGVETEGKEDLFQIHQNEKNEVDFETSSSSFSSLSSLSSSWWWNNNNSHSNHNNEHRPQISNSTSDACNIHSNCTSCVTSSIFCHWCAFDSQCHTKGSIHGCGWGESCSVPNEDDDDNNNNNNNNNDNNHKKCASHTSCTECSLSSNLCHWCAFDNACHVIGSWYGCTHGVNCFNNDRCQRLHPERIDYTQEENKQDLNIWTTVGYVPILIVGMIGLMGICCCSICFVSVRAMKGAYDDWAVVHYDSLNQHHHDGRGHGIIGGEVDYEAEEEVEGGGGRRRRRARGGGVRGTARANSQLANIAEGNEDVEEEKEEIFQDLPSPMSSSPNNNHHEDCDEERGDSSTTLILKDHDHDKEEGNSSGDDDDDNNTDSNSALTQPLLSSSSSSNKTKTITNQNECDDDHYHPSNRNIQGEEEEEEVYVPPSSRQSPLPQFTNSVRQNVNSFRSLRSSATTTTTSSTSTTYNKSIGCCYYSCLTTYILSILTTLFFVSATIYYFPKVPEFNVCSDEFAWNSIMDSITSLKMEASFEVLSSVKNTNHLDIILDGVGGSFRHNGEDIGTFSMKTTLIEADSITDVLVTCSVRPDRWEALGLISDYYRNKLEFLIDVSGNVKVKGIGYSIPISMKDMLIQVNDKDMDDRHLCHCPEWKDLYPTPSPVFGLGKSFEEQVEMMTRTIVTKEDNRSK